MSNNYKYQVNQQIDLRQYNSYCEDCLLRSIILARKYRNILESLIDKHKIPRNRSFEDRILQFICPAFNKPMDLYYDQGGPKMIQLYPKEEIAKIDEMIFWALKQLIELKIFKPS